MRLIILIRQHENLYFQYLINLWYIIVLNVWNYVMLTHHWWEGDRVLRSTRSLIWTVRILVLSGYSYIYSELPMFVPFNVLGIYNDIIFVTYYRCTRHTDVITV